MASYRSDVAKHTTPVLRSAALARAAAGATDRTTLLPAIQAAQRRGVVNQLAMVGEHIRLLTPIVGAVQADLVPPRLPPIYEASIAVPHALNYDVNFKLIRAQRMLARIGKRATLKLPTVEGVDYSGASVKTLDDSLRRTRDRYMDEYSEIVTKELEIASSLLSSNSGVTDTSRPTSTSIKAEEH